MEAGQGNPLCGAISVAADPHPPVTANPGTQENSSGALAPDWNTIASKEKQGEHHEEHQNN
jgi:hypothetical protein